MSAARVLSVLWTVAADVRYAARMLLRRPVWFVAVVLILAIGIAGNTVMFSLVQGVLLNPRALGYDDIGQLVLVYHQNREGAHSTNSYEEYTVWRDGARSLRAAGAYLQNIPLVLDGAESTRVIANLVTPSFFTALGTRAATGQLFDDPDGTGLGSHETVIVSHGLWQQRFGGDAALIGRVLSLSGRPYTVVGVLPAAFHHVTATLRNGFDADVYLPLAVAPDLVGRSILSDPRAHAFGVLARLAPGSTMTTARADLDALQRAAHDLPPEPSWTIQLGSVHEIVTAPLRTPLELLFVATGVVASIICANVASLLLANGFSRRRELALRVALGANRWRLFQQVLTETLVLAACGGLMALVLSFWMFDALRSFGGAALRSMVEIRPDGVVFLAAFGVSVVIGLACGLLPALDAGRIDVRAALMEDGRGSTGGRTSLRLRRGLVVAELVAAFVLASGALLLIASYRLLHEASPGFRTDHLLTGHLTMAGPSYDAVGARAALRAELLADIRSRPGVLGAILWSPQAPASSVITTAILATGRQGDGQENSIVSRYHLVSAGALTLLGIPIERGRDLGPEDTATSRPVAVVSRALARRLGAPDPLAATLQLFGSTQPVTIVGVAGDVQQRDRLGPYAQDRNDLYAAIEQWPGNRDVTLVARTSLPPGSVVPTLRDVVHRMAPRLPLYDVRTIDDVLAKQEAEMRLTGALTAIFAALAAILAIVGVHSVIADSVMRRQTEIGIRMALGAEPSRITGEIVRGSVMICLTSIALGWPLAFLAARTARAALFGVTESNLRVPLLVSAVLAVSVLLASYVPARRSTRIDPATAIRGSGTG
jgi:putative ABC transport system permease protein